VVAIPGLYDQLSGTVKVLIDFFDSAELVILSGVHDTGVGLLGYVMRGYLSPMAAVSMAGASPRLMGELLVAMGKTAPAIKAAASAATPTVRAIAPGVANATFNDSGTQPLAVSAPTQ
jgi:hypothetical protein